MTSELTISKPPRRALQRLMDLRLALALAILVGLIGLAGCRTDPVRDYNNQPVPAGVSMKQVGRAIREAGTSLGWAMKEEHPGKFTGTLYIRDHMAKVDIPYSKSSYSIRYVSSSNLEYNAEKRTIHSNYIGWVQNLNNGIRTRLGSL